jgi:hypothetical protein
MVNLSLNKTANENSDSARSWTGVGVSSNLPPLGLGLLQEPRAVSLAFILSCRVLASSILPV